MAARTTGVTISAAAYLPARCRHLRRRRSPPPRLVTAPPSLWRDPAPPLSSVAAASMAARLGANAAPLRAQDPGGPPSPLAARTSPTPGSPPPPISSQRPPISPRPPEARPPGETLPTSLSLSAPQILPSFFFFDLYSNQLL
ncbi:uncharacterized protein M6B38_205680 [Iris pallida]|uniref:Uncharacterized protein n=1 Tax=Iris pallida TaxID=29817 RepID=A0AAX6E6T1_IRIPA|nr:uncharacterized protein M6B38_205680 [Iris pallida]